MVSRLATEVLVDLCGMSMCLFQVSGNAMCVMRRPTLKTSHVTVDRRETGKFYPIVPTW